MNTKQTFEGLLDCPPEQPLPAGIVNGWDPMFCFGWQAPVFAPTFFVAESDSEEDSCFPAKEVPLDSDGEDEIEQEVGQNESGHSQGAQGKGGKEGRGTGHWHGS